MKYYILVVFVLMSHRALSQDFTGKWQVTKIETPEPYLADIPYPAYFELRQSEGQISGRYKDQFDFECEFDLALLVNNDSELLLMNCGSTQFKESWTPLHKVKFINGELVGTVVAYTQMFVWHASPVDPSPLTPP